MSDATERGGSLAALYRSLKKKEGGYIRMDKQKAIDQSAKNATMRGSHRKEPLASGSPKKGK